VAAFPGGDVGAMLESARRAYELEAERDTPWRVTVNVLLGFALVRAGRYMEALEPLKKGAALAVDAEMWLDAVGSRSVLARAELATGEVARAEHVAREALEMARRHGLLHTSTGAYAKAMLGLILTRRGDAITGEPLIAGALPTIRAIDEPLALAEVLIALALARRALGHRRSARALLREANGVIDACRDPGILRTTGRRRVAPPAASAGMPLSRRELEVLVLLSSGLSKREAASRLFVSFNTVHTQTRAVYRKLGVATRNAAIAQARQRGLIQ